MADWINHVAINAARNATTTHTNVDPASTGTVATGTAFTPTSGNLLVCFGYGAVTFTTPSGWTLATGGSVANIGGLYMFYRTASGTTADRITTTHNGSNYPSMFDFYEFPAGSTFNKATNSSGVVFSGGAGPTLSSITGTNWLAAVVGYADSTATVPTVTWSAGTELVDTGVAVSGTDGYVYGLAALDSSVLTSWSSAATLSSNPASNTCERLVVAVTAAAGAPATPPFVAMAPRQY
jgi:hypothetical protein